MIITQDKNKQVVQSHDFESVNCTIDAEDMRYVASLLRNNYSNTRLAVVREITANALDANAEANASRPIEVKLPTSMNPTFAVRDFGGGLSQEDVFGLYSKYGKSTKRESNNYIGAFGIGKFAPLSYGENFTCVSYHGGVKKTYNVFVNDDDDTKIAMIGEAEPTDEPTGLSIEVAVSDSDVSEFQEIAKKFFEFFSDEEMPKFIGVDDDFISPREKILESDNDDWFFVKENDSSRYGYRHGSNRSHILMGRVKYPIDTNAINLNNFVQDEKLRDICRNLLQQDNFYLRVPLGAVKLHHSRESLEYNKSTQKTIAKYLVVASKGVQAIAKRKLADSADLFEAKSNYAKVVNAMPYQMRNIFENSFEWNDIKITSFYFQRNHDYGESLIITQTDKEDDSDARDGYKVRSCKVNRVHCSEDALFAIQDIESAHGNNLRARTLFQKDDSLKTIYFIHPITDGAKDYMKNEWHFDQVDDSHIVYTSEVEKQKPIKTGIRQANGNSRANIPLFVMKTDKGYATRMADFWDNFEEQINDVSDVSDIQGSVNGKLVYVPIKNYNVSGDDYISMELDDLYRRLSQIRASAEPDTENKSIRLFGVRVGDVKKLDSDLWISYNDFYIQYCKDKVLNDVENATLAHQQFVFQEEKVQDKISKYGYTLNRLFTNSQFKLNNLDSDHLVMKVARDWKILEEGGNSNPIRVAMLHLYRQDKEWVQKKFPMAKTSANVFVANVECLVEKYPLMIYISAQANTWGNLNAEDNGLHLLDETERYIQLCDNQGVGE